MANISNSKSSTLVTGTAESDKITSSGNWVRIYAD